jgi:hypothetical protein
MQPPNPVNSQKIAGYVGVICSFIYLALFLPSFYIALLCPELFENPNITATIGIVIVFLSALPPVAIVASIGLIWFMYQRASYKAVYFFCAFPLIVSALVVLVLVLMRSMLL